MKKLFWCRRPFRRFQERNRGSILFLAVGSLAILTILAAGASSSVSQEWALASFLTDANTSYDYALSTAQLLKKIWASRPSPLTMTLTDLQSRDLAFGDRVVVLHCFDEEALVNLKSSSSETLLLLPGISGNEAILQAIQTTPIYVKEDLLLAEGVTQDVYDSLKDIVTVYGSGRVNINTVQADVLSVLGAPSELVLRIREYRAGADGQEGTMDDRVFDDLTRIEEDLEPFGLTYPEKEWIQEAVLAQKLSIVSGTIRCDMTVFNGKKPLRHFVLIVDLGTGALLRWDEE